MAVIFQEPVTGRQLDLFAPEPAEPFWLEVDDEPDLCDYQMFPASQQGPAEYCGNEQDPDSDYCSDHNPDRAEPDWDSIGKDQRYGFDE